MGNSSSQLTDQEVEQLKSVSNLSEKEIRDHYQGFKILCPSGKMDKKILSKVWNFFLKGSQQEPNAFDYIFDAFDKNDDGKLDFTEFVLAIAATNKKDLESRLSFAFDMMDRSHDQLISYDEIVKFLSMSIKLAAGPQKNFNSIDPKETATKFFQRLGFDQSAKLTKQQFIDGCKNDPELRKKFGEN